MKKIVISSALLIALLLLGCGNTSRGAASEEFRIGSEGVKLSFLDSGMGEEIIVSSENEEIDLLIEAQNRGAFPTTRSVEGKMWLSGFDKNVVSLPTEVRDFSSDDSEDLRGRSSLNPQGGQGFYTFEGVINPSTLEEGAYNPTIVAHYCYQYSTLLSVEVCVEREIHSPNKNKVCRAKDITLNTQGAPIAITKIEETTLSNKIQFNVHIKNVGGGQVVTRESYTECNPGSIPKKKDLDHVRVAVMKVSDVELECAALTGESSVRLIGGKGMFICKADKSSLIDDNQEAYVGVLEAHLEYAYRDSIRHPLRIVKIAE